MVGVARSKACGTCRRRKVKCDETKPSCMRCAQARIACEGFQQWPVFVVRNQSGYRKRRPFEEIKPPTQLLSLSFDCPSAESTGYISWFWDVYGIGSSTKSDGLSSSYWLYHFMDCQEPVFRRSLLAVSLTAFGKQFGRPEAITAGRRLYVSSLESLRKQMLLTESIEKEELPAAVCMMVLYEFVSPAVECCTNWLLHLDGLYSLISYRGPLRHCYPGSRTVLEHCRHLALIQHLALRKAPIFCSPSWLCQPWDGVMKDIPQLATDYGLQLASLYEKCDSVIHHNVQPTAVAELLENCIILYGKAQKLYNEQRSFDPVVESSIELMSKPCLLTASDTGKLTLSITILTIQLGACISAFQLVSQVSSLPLCSTEIPLVNVQSAIKDAHDLISMPDLLARQILAAVQTCPSDRTGGLDSIMIVYALKLASQCLTSDYSAAINCQRLIQQFDAQASRFRALLRPKQEHISTPAGLEQLQSNEAARTGGVITYDV